MLPRQHEIQDDARERMLISILGLTPAVGRAGIDATLGHHKFELKSFTTNAGVTTARDVTLDMIDKWRNLHWIVGRVSKHSCEDFESIYLLRQGALDHWFDAVSRKIDAKNALASKVLECVSQSDMITRTERAQLKKLLFRAQL
jgi:hypothetical protein